MRGAFVMMNMTNSLSMEHYGLGVTDMESGCFRDLSFLYETVYVD